MNTLTNVGRDEYLSTEQGLFIREAAVKAARRSFVGRKLFGGAIRKIDAGAQTFGYDTLTEMSNASFDWIWPGRESQDIINLARSSVAIPNIHKEFSINKLDLASSRNTGTPLNVSTAESAVYKVGYAEDNLLINGYSADGTVYDIKGLYQAATTNTSAGSDWTTSTNVPTDMQTLKSELMNDNIMPPYNFCCNPTNWMEAYEPIGTSPNTYQDYIKATLEGGTVFVTPAITAGTAFMCAANPEGKFEYVLAEDLTTETQILDIQHGSNLFGRVYLRGLPIVYDSNAIARVTTI